MDDQPDKDRSENPRTADDGEAVSGFPEPPGKDPGDISGDDEPHHSLSNPVGDPDPTERPEHYDEQEDLEADLGEPPEGDRLDE